MSRIGRIPIKIPKNVNIFFRNRKINIKGPFGELNQFINPAIDVIINNDKILLKRSSEKKTHKSLHGLYNSLINNMIIGVTNRFIKELELVGIGYRANINNSLKLLELSLVYSHDIIIQIPKEIELSINSEKGKNIIITIKSYDKQLLGIFSSKIRSLRKPEPYKGKGIRYKNEYIKIKTGKSA